MPPQTARDEHKGTPPLRAGFMCKWLVNGKLGLLARAATCTTGSTAARTSSGAAARATAGARRTAGAAGRARTCTGSAHAVRAAVHPADRISAAIHAVHRLRAASCSRSSRAIGKDAGVHATIG
jgi:uracil-DNA glycosylase